jgi:hypothetical protein
VRQDLNEEPMQEKTVSFYWLCVSVGSFHMQPKCNQRAQPGCNQGATRDATVCNQGATRVATRAQPGLQVSCNLQLGCCNQGCNQGATRVATSV